MDTYRTIRAMLSRKKLDGLLITDLLNIRYLTSFAGSSAALFVGVDGRNIFFTDFRYQYECEDLLDEEELVILKNDFYSGIRKKLKSLEVKNIGFEYGASYQTYDRLRKDFHLVSLKDSVERMRMQKESRELEHITLAVRRAEEAFTETKKWIRVGTKERKIALVLEERLKKAGCRQIPFDIIVASGKNSELPHAKVTEKKLESGDLVVFDWGGEAGGYMSDMSRTVLMRGPGTGKKKKMYETVLKANEKAIEGVKPGLSCRNVDSIARNIISGEGFGEYFGHATGHGVGLNVHERPSVSPRSRDVLACGMVITVEPGIYLPGVGGVRIEDMVVVERQKGRPLTALPKGMEIL
jgi:Xaa-Pro aminopeptidase